MIKNINKFVSTKRFNEILGGILVTPDKIVATDSFKLIEIKQKNPVDGPIIVKLPKGMNTFDSVSKDTIAGKHGMHVSELITGVFPDYEQIIPTTKPVYSFDINPTYMKDIMTAFAAGKRVTMDFFGPGRTMVITSEDQNMRALCMPISR